MALSDNLVFYSDMSDATSTTVTENTSTYTINKVSSSNPSEVTGKVGDGQLFTNDYLTTTFNADTTIGTGDFSMAVWFKGTFDSSRHSIIGFSSSTSQFWDALELKFGNNSGDGSTIQVTTRAGTSGGQNTVSSTGFGDNNWHLAIVTRTGTTVSLYIDNSLEDSTTAADNGVDIGQYNQIGRVVTYNAANNKTYDEVGYWSRVLTSDERTELWNSGAGITYADIIGGGGATLGLKLGSTTINKVMLGSTEIKKVYLGSTTIYENL